MTGDILHAKIEVCRKRYYKEASNFGIISFVVKEVLEGNEVEVRKVYYSAKGTMPKPIEHNEYILKAKEVEDPKWGKQFDVISIYSSVLLQATNKQGQRTYLESLFTERQVEAMYEALEDPFQAFKNDDVQALLSINGCRFKTAIKWLEKFKNNYGNARILVELADYNLTPYMMGQLLSKYKSPDIAIEKVKQNPYSLIEIRGIGWKKCDELALKGGMSLLCPERIEAFIKYYLYQMAEKGYTYVNANEQLMPAMLNTLGNDITDEAILEAVHRLEDKLVWNNERTLVGLKYYMSLEKKIAQKLIELRDAPNNFDYDNWEAIISAKEKEQDWCYTEQQIEGIKATLENQVVIITGYGGTGKSSIVSGMIAVLKKYDFAQCALSGRAAARLAEVTGEEGFTIHRLLKYPSTNPNAKQLFTYHDGNPLEQQIIIVDEVSMISGELFWYLIRALKPGTKLILLGDVGQLESIGCSNIANDLIESSEIKSVILDKIHRQAAASAIITESIKARHGEQVIDKDYAGIVTRGELQDLTYDCYSDMNNTFFKVLEYAEKLRNDGVPLVDTQIIVPIKERQSGTWNLNLALQEIYNPLNDREELIVSYEKGKVSAFRVGDKVINIQNAYDSRTYDGQWEAESIEAAQCMGEECPIYNGNMGIVLAINSRWNEMIVDFIGLGKVRITSDMLSKIMLGYAVTVHKCQGSEFKHVIFGIDFSSYSLLTRQMIYTAITRASQHCYVLAQTSALRYAISQNAVSSKQTILKEMLYEVTHPKMIF